MRIKTAFLRDKKYLDRCKQMRGTNPELFKYVPPPKVVIKEKIHKFTGFIYDR